MIVNRVLRRFLKGIQFDFMSSDRPWHRFYRYLVISMVLYPIIPGVRMQTLCMVKWCVDTFYLYQQAVFILKDITDFTAVSEALKLHIVIISAAIKGIVFLREKDTVKLLLQAAQRRVDRREHRAHHYLSMNRIGNVFIATYFILALMGWLCLFFTPLILNLIRYMQGTLRPEMWIQLLGMTFV